MNNKIVSELLVQSAIEFEKVERFTEFFRFHTLGVPLAYFILTDAITGLNETGQTILSETWNNFCAILKVDPTLEWESLEEMQLGFMFDEDDDEDDDGEYF
jgi:hypothetical protein